MKMHKLTPLLLLAILSGCATLPTGPSVNVLPAQGKPFEKFMAEDTTCRNWAQQQLGKPTQEGYEENVAKGAVAGTAVGAGVGAAFGAASHHAGAGAAIGAASGLLLGSLVGNDNGQAYGHEAQRRYDNAYVQCMYSYGNQIPGRKLASAAPARPAAPPPPPPAPVVTAPPPVAVAPPPPPVMAAEPEAYPPPPEVYFNEAPQFVYSPQMNMYVAVDVPYDLLYNGSDYFYFYGGRWYRSPYYDGPWAFVPRRAYPPAFVSYRIANIRRFREHEYRRYLRDRAHYDGRVHRPAYRKRIADHR